MSEKEIRNKEDTYKTLGLFDYPKFTIFRIIPTHQG